MRTRPPPMFWGYSPAFARMTDPPSEKIADPPDPDKKALGAASEPRAAPGTFGPSQEELQDYADEVNQLIRDMNAHIGKYGDTTYSDAAKAYAVAPWSPFLLDWRDQYAKIPDVWFQSSAWDEVRASHAKALEHKRQFERHGVQFTVQTAPGKEEPLKAPPKAQTSETRERQEEEEERQDERRGKRSSSGAAGWYVAGGLALIAVGTAVGISVGRR